MWILKDQTFIKEQQKFNLVSNCEDCQHFREQKQDCAMLYPVQKHLKATFKEASENDRIYFCKMFEVKR